MFFIFPRIKNNITKTVNETGSYKVTGTEDGVNIERDDN